MTTEVTSERAPIIHSIPLAPFVVLSSPPPGSGSTPVITVHHTRAVKSWIKAHGLVALRRKNSALVAEWMLTDEALQVTTAETITSSHTTTADAMDSLQRQLDNTLKKVEVEDLGDMNALELWNRIPLQDDNQGRGRKDLARMQKELHVHVEFAENGHVYLVGPKAKLTKKCITLRNVLAHYHWRLSGKDNAGRR